jgi:Uma2 family endonuclease
MSQPALSALEPLPFELVFDDGEPMENRDHVVQRDLLMDVTARVMQERGRDDFETGGNMFVYYSVEQARDVASGRPYFRGPDFYLVDRVPKRYRQGWVAWEEGGRLPDLIVEFLSPSTEDVDRKDKMELYAKVFRTRDYFLWSFERRRLEGYRLEGDRYRPLRPDSRGRFRSEVLGLDLGVWEGRVYFPHLSDGREGHWVRLFDVDGRLIPQGVVAAAEEAQARLEAERRRAEAAEAELQRLRALLGESGRQG